MPLGEATRFVNDGDHVAVGGCPLSRPPTAMNWALIRERKKRLTVSRSITSNEGDLLFASGAASKIITSWFTQGIVWGVSKVMRHHTENKLATYEEWSHMAIGLRYRAGAMGVPFMPTRVIVGSDIERELAGSLQKMKCPYTGEEVVLLPALNPDVALIHVPICALL